MSAPISRAYLEAIPAYQLIVRIALLRSIIEDSSNFTSLEAFVRRLDHILSAHSTVYFEQSFEPHLLRDIPRYLVCRFHAFGTPICEEHIDEYTSGEESPNPHYTRRS
jgi:hypothetical protein